MNNRGLLLAAIDFPAHPKPNKLMVIVAGATAFFFAIPFLLELWAIRLSRGATEGSFVCSIKYILPALFVLSALVAIGTGAVEAFSSHHASNRAAMIADGVATAMNCGAFFFLVVDVSALIALSAFSLRVRRPAA